MLDVVAAILIYEKSILAFKRDYSEDKNLSLKYEFPGGKVKKNESYIKAIKRELKEELNLEVKKLSLFYKNFFSYPNLTVNLRFYTSRISDLDFSLKEHISYRVLELKDLRSVEWLAADYPVINYMEKKLVFFNKLVN